MNNNQKLLKDLEKVSKEGVLIYQGDRLSSPEEVACTTMVREDNPYVPDFIVLDETGQLKEIWYGKQDNT
jgi:hypothetical protein